MTILLTIAQLALVWLGACAMGFALVKACVPRDVEAEHGVFLMPSSGLLTLCLTAFTLSASFGLSAANAVWAAMGLLLVAAAATQMRPAWRIDPAAGLRDLRRSLVLMWPMALVTLGPFLYLGADGYLGAVNPDFFAGLVDLYYLMQGHSATTFAPTSRDTFYPMQYTAGTVTASARFGSELFGAAVHLALRVDLRAALALTIAFSMLCLPLTLYSFSRMVLGFDQRVSRWTAWLIGIAAPIGMSYLYSYLGQNAALPAIPLLLMAVFLMLMRPGVGTLVFCAVLAHGLFVNYLAMLPFALAPAGPLWLYLVATRRLRLRTGLLLAVGFTAINVGLVAGNFGATVASMRGWLGIIGQSLQGQYFIDFLTESFLAYFFGIYNYVVSPWVVRLLGVVPTRLLGFAASLACIGVAAWSIRRWTQDTASLERRIFVLSTLFIYIAVWVQYSFFRQYGYAVFKMSSWLQFMLVPFMGYAIHALSVDRAQAIQTGAARPARRRVIAAAASFVAGFYVVMNVVASGQYAYNGFGRNKDNGYIVNHFGMSGNKDFFELKEALSRHMKPDESVGLLFTDSIRNWWTSYYIRDFRQSFLSHHLMPGDDENLPTVGSNLVMDYYGNVKTHENQYMHGGTRDQYLLTWNYGDLNPDIVPTEISAKPLWENKSFRLFRSTDVNDLLFTGAGFYRLEYMRANHENFLPNVMRWSADGGEFYVLRPSQPGMPYRLVFDAIVGYESPTDGRTLEFFQDGKKFGESSIMHTARVVTPPFLPGDGITKLVVRIKERNKPIPRGTPLWNRDIPEDYRRLNVAFANARLLSPTGAPPAKVELGSKIPLMSLTGIAERFDGFESGGWMGEMAEITVRVPKEAKAVEITGHAPGNLGFRFPYKVKLKVNGQETNASVSKPGDFALSGSVPAHDGQVTVEIIPSQTRDIGEVELRRKVISRSLRIDNLAFR